ncbi:TIGR03943 family putative permease subunit [Peribacillus asahii]|uniref:DNA-binding protein n=1 Tax=Peribacillus asahii TaxID=228899 RepID=A0A3Q9RMR1_9BACI|nr:TIGR03943 family protein [Peribacillus asahii]AZV42692.1 DNA-binding protein [Peribacillus asahii]USK86953.1 TIGR03943 family protein [Peribacillus asahii]
MKRSNQGNVSYHHLIRGIVLIGLALLVFKLLVTNHIAFFIAPQMVRFIYFSFIVLLILSIILILRGTSEKNHYSCHCDGEHTYPTSSFKSIMLYGLFILPITTGFLFSDNVLDSSVAMNRPITLVSPSQNNNTIRAAQNSTDTITVSDRNANQAKSISDNSNPSSAQQEPLSEKEYSSLQNQLEATNHIKMNDEYYVPIINILSEDLSNMIGKTITTKGFVYREQNFFQDEIVIARFSIVCCVADSSVYGIMAKGNVAHLPKDQWIQVTGKIDQVKYDGLTVPIIKIKKLSKIPVPENPYVYDVGVQIN